MMSVRYRSKLTELAGKKRGVEWKETAYDIYIDTAQESCRRSSEKSSLSGMQELQH